MKVYLCNLVLACGLLAAVSGRAAPVRGVVQFPEEGAVHRGGFWRVPNGALPVAAPLHDPRADALVVLTPTASTAVGDKAERADKPEVRVHGLRVQPAATLAALQSALTVHNEDRRPLLLTLSCPGAALERLSVPASGQRLVTLSTAGVCTLRSPSHGHLEGMVLVEPVPSLVAHTDTEGGFRLDAPAGTYQARVLWHGLVQGPQPVTVAAEGAELKFALRPATEGKAEPPSEPPQGAASRREPGEQR